MNINFPPVDEGFIKTMVKSGYYSNATELVRDAVRRLRERETSPEDRLLAALQAAEDEIAAGKGIPYTPDFLDQCEKEARRDIAKGKKPKPDVLP